ncbi:MAG: hypothetical protein WCK02_07620 [Bacteroidota bacterium]
METRNKIDYKKFKCEIYSPDGILLNTAQTNEKNEFYAPSLVTGQKYYLVFSYDEILIECLVFTCENAGKVVYLSPAHIIYNQSAERPPITFIGSIKTKIKKRIDFNVPQMAWSKKALDAFIHSTHSVSSRNKHKSKHALDAFIESTHEGAKKLICQNDIIALKAGADLSNKVK